MSQYHLYMDIFGGLGELAYSDALLEGDTCLTLRNIQGHLVRCATCDGFSEFYDCEVDDDCNKIEEDCVSIARKLYVNPIWLYNGPELCSSDRKLNKQKITRAIRECTSSLKDDQDEAEDNMDNGNDDDDDACDKKSEADEEDEDEVPEILECTETDGDATDDDVDDDDDGDWEEDIHEHHENECEKSRDVSEEKDDDGSEEKDDDVSSFLSSNNRSIDGTGEECIDDSELSLKLSLDGKNDEEEECIVDWVDDMDIEEVLRIDRSYMNIENDIIKDFEFFK